MQRKYKIYHFQKPPFGIWYTCTHSPQQTWIRTNEHQHFLTPSSPQKSTNELIKNIYIHIFQRHTTIINEQSQIGENLLVDLFSDITLKHACAWPYFFLPDWSSVRTLYVTYWQPYSLHATIYNFIYKYINNFLHTHTHTHTHFLYFRVLIRHNAHEHFLTN
jgi:hypothetical protein